MRTQIIPLYKSVGKFPQLILSYHRQNTFVSMNGVSCLLLLLILFKVLFRPAHPKLQPTGLPRRRLPLNKTTCQDHSFTSTASFDSPWGQQTHIRPTFNVMSTTVQDSYRFSHCCTDPRPSINPYKVSSLDQTAQRSSQTILNVPAYYDRYMSTYPTLKDILQSPTVVPQSRIISCPTASQDPENLRYTEVRNIHKTKASPDQLHFPYFAMNDVPRAIPLVTPKNRVASSQGKLCSTPKSPLSQLTPILSSNDSLKSSQGRYCSASTGNGVNMSATFALDEYQVSCKTSQEVFNSSSSQETLMRPLKSEPILNKVDCNSSVWSETGNTSSQPYMVHPLSDCTCQPCKGNQSQFITSDYFEQGATGLFLNL